MIIVFFLFLGLHLSFLGFERLSDDFMVLTIGLFYLTCVHLMWVWTYRVWLFVCFSLSIRWPLLLVIISSDLPNVRMMIFRISDIFVSTSLNHILKVIECSECIKFNCVSKFHVFHSSIILKTRMVSIPLTLAHLP